MKYFISANNLIFLLLIVAVALSSTSVNRQIVQRVQSNSSFALSYQVFCLFCLRFLGFTNEEKCQ